MSEAPLGKPPCGSCTHCCRNWSSVELKPEMGDDPSQYECALAGEVLILAFKPNGDCVYLGENGCTIHGRAPVVCREFDCRSVFLEMTRAERRQAMKQNVFDSHVLGRGRELAHTLSEEDRRTVMALRQAGVGRMMLRSCERISARMGRGKDGVVANVILGKPEAKADDGSA